MRQKLFREMLAIIVVIVLLTEVTMAVAFGLSLGSGFGDYLSKRDLTDIDRFRTAYEAELSATFTPDTLLHDPAKLTSVLHRPVLGRVPGSQGQDWILHPPLGPETSALPGFLAPPPPPPPEDARLDHQRPRPSPPPVAHPLGEAFETRLMIFDGRGKQIFGPPAPTMPEERNALLMRPIMVRGQTVAQIQVVRVRPSSSIADNQFLTDQFTNIARIGAIILLLCTLPAALLARIATGRLDEVKKATRAIANGDFTVTLAERGSREVAETLRNINLMTRSLQRLELARRQWLADVSHELRTPLAALRGELDAMLDGVRPLSIAALTSLNEEVLRLNDLVEDLHLLAVADLDGPICQFVETDASAVCRKAVDRFAEPALARSLHMRLDGVASALPVQWDPARIDQVLGNILTNSLRYTDAPGEIRLAVEPFGDAIRIVVEDSSPCPSIQDLPHLFEPLYRVDAHRNRTTGGSGLGLSICEAIMRRHKGTITASQSKLGGLKITMELPRIVSET